MRPATVFLLLALLGNAPAPGAGGPWTGILPDPDPPGDLAGREWLACRILDGETGDPVPGARLVRSPEWIAPWRRRQDTVLSVGVADADGVAAVPAVPEVWADDCHWLVLAPGYAPAHDYGIAPDPEVRLERGAPLEGRVVGPMGHPVAGAVVEYLGGCSHGTAAARAVADGNGRFRIERIPTGVEGQLWVKGPGIASDLLASFSPPSLGSDGVVLAMDSGRRYEGRVVDLLGRPLADVVVRAYNEQRGPTTVTDPAGRFVLEGVEDEALFFYPAADLADDDARRFVDDARPGEPMTVVLSPLGVAAAPATARVRIRAGRSATDRESVLYFRLLGAQTGRGPWDGATPAEPVVEEVPPGTYRIVPAEPFARFGFAPVAVAVRAGETAEVTLDPVPRPALALDGVLPPKAHFTLAVPGRSAEFFPDDFPHLPPDADAAVRVEVEGRPPFFFPVGPVENGVRRATIDLPTPKRIRTPPGAREARLFDGTRDAYGRCEDGEVLTDATGPLTLVFEDAEGDLREAPVDVPAQAGAIVDVDPARGRPARAAFHPFGSRRSLAAIRVLDPSGELLETFGGTPGEMYVFEREGWRRLRDVAPETGGATLRLGPATLSLRIVEPDGTPADAIALAGGEVYAAPEGRLVLRGFDAGPLRVVVARRDVRGPGRQLALELEAGPARAVEVRLPEDE